MTRWCSARSRELMRPQRPTQHEPVEQDHGRALAALDDVDRTPVVGLDDVGRAVLGNGETLRGDVVGSRLRARHEAVLGRPTRRQGRARPRRHAAYEPAPVQRSLVAHR